MSWLRLAEPPPQEELRALVLRDGRAVDVRWVRDGRARRLRLIVGERGVRLTVPRSASVGLAERFLFEHRDWLAEQLERRPPVDDTPFAAARDRALPLRGERLPIEWCEGRYLRIDADTHGLRITRSVRSTDAQLRAALRAFYLQQAQADLGRWLPRYLPALPRAPSALKLRPLSSLWGSLSPSDAVSLDLALVIGRPSAFEYVLVHELCHLLHRDHSRRFWREVELRWPDWRAERDYLHGEGLAIKAELRRLIAR